MKMQAKNEMGSESKFNILEMIPRTLIKQQQMNEKQKLKRVSSNSKSNLLQYNESDENLLQFSEDSEDREERLALEAAKVLTEEEKEQLELEK